MQSNYRWDRAQTSTGLSHFTDQLDRQSKLPNRVAIFEMFYCEARLGKQPKYMKDEGSTCTWHDEALSFNNQRHSKTAIWDNKDLEGLLKPSAKSIGDIFQNICECKKGEPIHYSNFLDMHGELKLPNDILLIGEDVDTKVE